MRKTSVIPSGVTLVGDIEGDADLVVHGRVEGPIHVGGTLVIEGSGVVRGHVRASAVIVRGVLKGNAFGDELVRVDEGARLVGELTAPRVQVVPGAHFRGQIHVATVGEPRLTSYDPTLHTFSGWPSPEPVGAVKAPVSPAASAPELSKPSAPPTFDESFEPVGVPHIGEAADVTLFEARAPEQTHVVEPAAGYSAVPAATSVAHAVVPEPTRVVEPAATAPAAQAATLAATSVAHSVASEQTHVVDPTEYAARTSAARAATPAAHAGAPASHASSSHATVLLEEHAPDDVDATLSEAYPPPPERLPSRMPRLGGRTPGTRRWT